MKGVLSEIRYALLAVPAHRQALGICLLCPLSHTFAGHGKSMQFFDEPRPAFAIENVEAVDPDAALLPEELLMALPLDGSHNCRQTAPTDSGRRLAGAE